MQSTGRCSWPSMSGSAGSPTATRSISPTCPCGGLCAAQRRGVLWAVPAGFLAALAAHRRLFFEQTLEPTFTGSSYHLLPRREVRILRNELIPLLALKSRREVFCATVFV